MDNLMDTKLDQNQKHFMQHMHTILDKFMQHQQAQNPSLERTFYEIKQHIEQLDHSLEHSSSLRKPRFKVTKWQTKPEF